MSVARANGVRVRIKNKEWYEKLAEKNDFPVELLACMGWSCSGATNLNLEHATCKMNYSQKVGLLNLKQLSQYPGMPIWNFYA